MIIFFPFGPLLLVVWLIASLIYGALFGPACRDDGGKRVAPEGAAYSFTVPEGLAIFDRATAHRDGRTTLRASPTGRVAAVGVDWHDKITIEAWRLATAIPAGKEREQIARRAAGHRANTRASANWGSRTARVTVDGVPSLKYRFKGLHGPGPRTDGERYFAYLGPYEVMITCEWRPIWKRGMTQACHELIATLDLRAPADSGNVLPKGLAPYSYGVPNGFWALDVGSTYKQRYNTQVSLGSASGINVHTFPFGLKGRNHAIGEVLQRFERGLSQLRGMPRAWFRARPARVTVAGNVALRYEAHGLHRSGGASGAIRYFVFPPPNSTLSIHCQWQRGMKEEILRGCAEVRRSLQLRNWPVGAPYVS